jgi:hypothetical protein
LVISSAARKYGMADILPAGTWIEGIGGRPIKITFSSFKTPVVTAENQRVVEVSLEVAGIVEVADRKASFSGKATMQFSRVEPSFSMCAVFPFPGKELGLVGSKGEGITATLYTASASNLTSPTGPDASGKDDGMSVLDDRSSKE